MTIIAAIPGILTRQTDVSWPDKLDAWFSARNNGVRVLKKEYCAGPFPRWNCLVRNPRLALGLANEVRLMIDARGAADRQPHVWFVAHSNGALVALAAIRRIIASGRNVAGLILIGAACDADAQRNGVLRWLRSGQLGMALAYCSTTDGVLPRTRVESGSKVISGFYKLLAWPYGSLGRTGWRMKGRPLSPGLCGLAVNARIITRWFEGGHSGYFSPARIDYTFRQIEHDVFDAQERELKRVSMDNSQILHTT